MCKIGRRDDCIGISPVGKRRGDSQCRNQGEQGMEMWNRRKCWNIKYEGVSGWEGEGGKAQGCLGAVWESFAEFKAEKRSGSIFSVRILLPWLESAVLESRICLLHLDGSCLAQHMEEKRWSGLSQLGGHLDLACWAREVAHQAVPAQCSLGLYLIGLSHDKGSWHWARLCHKTFSI